MKSLTYGGVGIAVAATLSLTAIAQEAGQGASPQIPSPTASPQTASPTAAPQPAAPSAVGTAGVQADQTVTITGCIASEADYRKAQGAGGGGVAGTGIGAGNEYILTDATMASSGAGPSSVGTTGSTASGAKMAYELTGSGEGQAGQFVGKRVEITGKLKAGDTTAAGATGGPTAAAPPRGVDVASKDLKLREFEVTSVKAATSGSCTP
jgi:hypothetical protein